MWMIYRKFCLRHWVNGMQLLQNRWIHPSYTRGYDNSRKRIESVTTGFRHQMTSQGSFGECEWGRLRQRAICICFHGICFWFSWFSGLWCTVSIAKKWNIIAPLCKCVFFAKLAHRQYVCTPRKGFWYCMSYITEVWCTFRGAGLSIFVLRISEFWYQNMAWILCYHE